jgi:hypothetical protein
MIEYAGRVGILGCGPAGLAAAHAAAIAGYEPVIFSRKIKSTLYGSQYLHAPIPGMTSLPPVEVRYRLLGQYSDYQAKVYGKPMPMVSDEEDEFRQSGSVVRPAWDIRQTYDALWNTYEPYIQDLEFGRFRDTSYVLHGMGRMVKVYSTIPRTLLCLYQLQHSFNHATAWVAGEAPDLGIEFDFRFMDQRTGKANPSNTIYYDARAHWPWYKVSDTFGHKTIEWPGYLEKPADYPTASLVRKPLGTDCDCWPQITKLGRYGAWDRSQLVHHAFGRVAEDLAALELES